MRHVQPICHRAGNHFWSGSCLRGRLHGAGVLIWFEDGVETERDEGTFRNGELDGPSVITLADRTTIFGNYRDGVRHGEFMNVQTNGSYIQSIYANGTLIGQKSLDRAEIRASTTARSVCPRATWRKRVATAPRSRPFPGALWRCHARR